MSTKVNRWWIIPVFVLVSIASAYAQQHYAVVGVFADECNARKFTGYVRSHLVSADYELNLDENKFYVYALKTTSREAAQAKVKELQKGEFKDAWLFSGQLVVETPIAAEPPREEPKQPESISVPEPVDTTSAISTVIPEESDIKVKGKLFKFVLRTPEGKPVKGEVHSVDYKRSRDLATYASDRYVDITHPSSEHNPMSLVCGIFGYKEVVKFLDYKDPSLTEGASQDTKGAWVIPYHLERMKKGDVSVMYHVSFYKDAVVMLPQSKTELDELVRMMADNPNYKIVIHGHCNGNSSRKIIALGQTKNYFSVSGSEEKTGTAKELSKLRAEAVQVYLADNGIDKGRSETYAWGSLNMLVPETSTSAKLNDRIEIEIVQD
jgi:outer membrane protein OmpA-like peptidoglycan-associated protein